MRLVARQTTRVGFIRRLGRSPCEALSDIPCEFSIEVGLGQCSGREIRVDCTGDILAQREQNSLQDVLPRAGDQEVNHEVPDDFL